MILPALLLALATVVLLHRAQAPARLRQLLGPPAAPREARALPRTAVFAAVGLVLWSVVGGLAGAVLGLALGVLGPPLVARLDRPEDDTDALATRLPLALDLLGACLEGGGVLLDAVDAVALAVGGPCGLRLSHVAAALRVGSPAEEAFAMLGDGPGPAGAAARALSRAAAGGIPVAAAVSGVAREARRAAATAGTRRAKRAGVLAVGPLGACFLPAFALLGVVPVVAGLARPLLAVL